MIERPEYPRPVRCAAFADVMRYSAIRSFTACHVVILPNTRNRVNSLM
jgi:hypothetical protein